MGEPNGDSCGIAVFHIAIESKGIHPMRQTESKLYEKRQNPSVLGGVAA